MPRFKGIVGLTEQQPEFDYTPEAGHMTTRVFHGTRSAVMSARSQFAALGYRYTTRGMDGGLAELRASISELEGSTAAPINTWQLLGSDQQTDIRLHPYFDAVTVSQMEVIDQKLDDSESVSIADSLANELYEFLRRGQNVFQESRYILRYTQSSSRNFPATISVTGVDKLWTASQIATAHGSIPSTISNAINNIPEPGGKTGYLFRWLKSAPQLEKAYNQSTVITIDWKLDLWPTALYSNA